MNKKIVYTLFAIFILIILLSCNLKLSNTEENKELISSQDSTEKGLYVGCAPDTFMGAGIQTCIKAIQEGKIGRPVAGTALEPHVRISASA